LFLDDQVIVTDSEDPVQILVHKMETFTPRHGLKISRSKTKKKSFKGRDPVISKVVIYRVGQKWVYNNTILNTIYCVLTVDPPCVIILQNK